MGPKTALPPGTCLKKTKEHASDNWNALICLQGDHPQAQNLYQLLVRRAASDRQWAEYFLLVSTCFEIIKQVPRTSEACEQANIEELLMEVLESLGGEFLRSLEQLLANPEPNMRQIMAFIDPSLPTDDWISSASTLIRQKAGPRRENAALEAACQPGQAVLEVLAKEGLYSARLQDLLQIS